MPAEGGHARASIASGFAALDAWCGRAPSRSIGASDDADADRRAADRLHAGAGLRRRHPAGEPEPRRRCRGCAPSPASARCRRRPTSPSSPCRRGRDAGRGRPRRQGCRAAICFTAGFAEVDEAGAAMQDRLVAAARAARHAAARAELPRPVQRGDQLLPDLLRQLREGLADPGANVGIASQSGAYGTHVFAVARSTAASARRSASPPATRPMSRSAR